MQNLTLKKVEITDKEQFEEALKELLLSSGALKGVYYQDGLHFEQLIEFYDKCEKIPFNNYSQEEYPFLQYLLVENEQRKIVGFVNLRPFLTKSLDENYEGNIGYSIRPSERGKGYANQALSLAVKEFKRLNAKDNITICCYKENVPSKKVILNNGGVLKEEKQGMLTAQKYIIK